MKIKIILSIVAIVIVASLFIMSPIFAIKSVTVSGTQKLTKSEVMSIANIYEGMNIFRVSINKSNQNLLANNYIKYAETAISLPNSVQIDIVERKISGYVPFSGAYLYIDQDGFVVDSKAEKGDDLPVVEGLKFDDFSVGRTLNVENKATFDAIVLIATTLAKYDYINKVDKINISNVENIHLYIDNIDVSFGETVEADKKIRTIIEIVKNISEGDRGILHIENMNETPYFSYGS